MNWAPIWFSVRPCWPAHLFQQQNTDFTEKPPVQAVFLRFEFGFCDFDDCCFVAVQGAGQQLGHE